MDADVLRDLLRVYRHDGKAGGGSEGGSKADLRFRLRLQAFLRRTFEKCKIRFLIRFWEQLTKSKDISVMEAIATPATIGTREA